MARSTDNGWGEHIANFEKEATEAFTPGMTYQPHNGTDSDLNLHLHDMLAGPNPNVPDVMADWTPGGES